MEEYSSLNEEGIERHEPLETAPVETVPHPKQQRWRPGTIEGDIGPEYEAAFLTAQMEIGPILLADAENAFNKSKYLSLPSLLAKVVPVANRYGLTLKQGAGRIIMFGAADNPRRLLLQPIWTVARHSETGQWERVTIEIPLIKLDPQGLASTFTYGRRVAMQGFWCLAGTDDDGVLGSLRPKLENSPIDDISVGLIDQIRECQSLPDLKDWYRRNEQGFELLSEPVLQKLREAYASRSAELKADGREKPAGKRKAADAGS